MRKAAHAAFRRRARDGRRAPSVVAGGDPRLQGAATRRSRESCRHTGLLALRALTGGRVQEPKLLGVAEGGRSLARRGSAREGRDERGHHRTRALSSLQRRWSTMHGVAALGAVVALADPQGESAHPEARAPRRDGAVRIEDDGAVRCIRHRRHRSYLDCTGPPRCRHSRAAGRLTCLPRNQCHPCAQSEVPPMFSLAPPRRAQEEESAARCLERSRSFMSPLPSPREVVGVVVVVVVVVVVIVNRDGNAFRRACRRAQEEERAARSSPSRSTTTSTTTVARPSP